MCENYTTQLNYALLDHRQLKPKFKLKLIQLKPRFKLKLIPLSTKANLP